MQQGRNTTQAVRFLIGTSGYAFDDWVGPFYPPDLPQERRFAYYAERFDTLELNFTYYRMPTEGMMQRFARTSPEGFTFWVKANQETTHKQNRDAAGPFRDAMAPLAEAGKLGGVLLQFPQSFHRTIDNRRYLDAALTDLDGLPLAVEFRHASWAAPPTTSGLARRGVTLVVPDVPPLTNLYRSGPAATTTTGYLRLHSRDAAQWYAGAALRYDYSYGDDELRELAAAWTEPALGVQRVFAFFNNCHRGQAAVNAQRFEEIVADILGNG
ncbi:MAG: DUF72 domain-containing protein [Planctomycetes bacterium]|nr:DUF72 domain-containing protein [Planctomycetota bacterium]